MIKYSKPGPASPIRRSFNRLHGGGAGLWRGWLVGRWLVGWLPCTDESVAEPVLGVCADHPGGRGLHCKNKMVALTNLGYLSCIFTTKQCAHKQIN